MMWTRSPEALQVIRQSFLMCSNIRRTDAGPTSKHAYIFKRQMFNFVSIILQQFHNFSNIKIYSDAAIIRVSLDVYLHLHFMGHLNVIQS